MLAAIRYQVLGVLVVSWLAGLAAGLPGAVSAFLGGACSVLPNALFALRLMVAARRPGSSYVLNFFLGEGVKVAATIGLLVIVVKSWGGVHWPSLLAGLIVALQAGFLAFWKRS